MKFLLNGCDISFYAEAPEDITLKQLLQQCDRIVPDWCACGICSSDHQDKSTEIYITYDNIWKANENVSCTIKESNELNNPLKDINPKSIPIKRYKFKYKRK